jgi:hypothetical protein
MATVARCAGVGAVWAKSGTEPRRSKIENQPVPSQRDRPTDLMSVRIVGFPGAVDTGKNLVHSNYGIPACTVQNNAEPAK